MQPCNKATVEAFTEAMQASTTEALKEANTNHTLWLAAGLIAEALRQTK